MLWASSGMSLNLSVKEQTCRIWPLSAVGSETLLGTLQSLETLGGRGNTEFKPILWQWATALSKSFLSKISRHLFTLAVVFFFIWRARCKIGINMIIAVHTYPRFWRQGILEKFEFFPIKCRIQRAVERFDVFKKTLEGNKDFWRKKGPDVESVDPKVWPIQVRCLIDLRYHWMHGMCNFVLSTTSDF